MAGYSPERAMREFLRRGGQNQRGLDDLARQVAAKRRELLQKHSLDGTLEEVRELLEQAVLKERGQLARDVQMDDGDRALRELQLDNLPTSTAAAVTELSSYDWASQEAREDFEKIKDLLGREMLDQRFEGMKEALENATDEDRQRINEMLTDLNELLDKHRRGEDTDQDFADFMDKHGDFFPENPQNIDELMDSLAQRAAAAQRMRNSMTQEQRDELDALASQAFGSPELMQSLSQLDDNLRALRPGEDWGGSEEFGGQEGLGLGDGTGVLQDLAELDDLVRAALPVVRRRPDGRRRPRQAVQAAGRAGRCRRQDPGRARAGAQRHRLPQARIRRPAQALAQGDAPAGQGVAQGRRQPDVGTPGPARPAPCRCGRRAEWCQPRVDLRRHRAVERDPHDHQRGRAHGRRGRRRRRKASVSTYATSRSTRPRPAPRPRSRCSWTRRSRWRWPTAGCR